ncbi:uncharacterized protein [Drosophila tropicalis]|uniref:uncharacterized protein n=1 Tax=Drosophila tropicalis TaxID=46794 RepID=UPI0035ABA3E9
MLQSTPSALNVKYGQVVNSTDVVKEAFEKRYELIMPVKPNSDPGLCHDEFLRQLFADWDMQEIPDYGAYYHNYDDVGDYDDNDYDDYDKGDHKRKNNGNDKGEGIGEDGDGEDDVFQLELLSRIGSGSSIFSLAPNYVTKYQWSFNSFLRKMKRKTIFSSLVREISSKELRGDMDKLNIIAGEKSNFNKLLESMQRSSLFFANSRAIYRLLILKQCPQHALELDIRKIPHNLFSWSLEDFFKRREVKNFVYLDVLVRNHSWDTLEWAKYRCDLLETLRFFKFFYDQIIKGHDYRKLLSVMWEEKQMLTIDKSLERSLAEAQEELATASFKSRRFSQAWWEQYKRNVSSEVQRNLVDMSVRRPIEMRYLESYYSSLVESETMKYNIRTNQLKKELLDLKESMRVKHITSNSAMNVYYNIIETYKQRINYFTKRLDHEMEHWEDEILLNNFRLSKANSDLKEAQEKMAFMQKRIAEVQAEIDAEEMEQIYYLAHEQEIRQQKIVEEEEAKRQQKLAKLKKARAKRAAAVARRQSKVKSRVPMGKTTESFQG